EPGEVQAVLAGHTAVAQAAVIVQEDRPGGKRLVGYLVPTAGIEPDMVGGRGDAAQRLPEYMLPGLVVLDPLPVTGNGKLDRAALPAPQIAVAGGRAPATAVEEVLCSLFAEVLGTQSVPASASFFDLGGDSLIAMRLIARIRAVLDIEVSVGELFTS